jgi:hypothetical protein
VTGDPLVHEIEPEEDLPAELVRREPSLLVLAVNPTAIPTKLLSELIDVEQPPAVAVV